MTKKILIVEDEEPVLELLCELFGDMIDYDIFRARDGEEALRIAGTNRPDIILLDIQLPKKNGYEVCKSVKSDPALSNIKVLILSGVVQESDKHKSFEVGADGFIAKPFNSIMLVNRVGELLEGNQ